MAFCLNWVADPSERISSPPLDDDSAPFGRGKRVRLVKEVLAFVPEVHSLDELARHIGESRDDLIKWERMGRNFSIIRDKLRDLRWEAHFRECGKYAERALWDGVVPIDHCLKFGSITMRLGQWAIEQRQRYPTIYCVKGRKG